MKKLVILCATYLLIMLPAALFAGCQTTATPAPTAPPATESPTTNKTYTNKEYQFSVEYPADWDMKDFLSPEEKLAGIIAIFQGPKSEEYNRRVSITLEAEELPAGFNTEKYAAAVEEQILKENLPDYANRGEQATTIGGLSALTRVFTATIDRAPSKLVQAYFTKENIGYVITYQATPDVYDEYADAFDLATSTFKFQ